MDFLDPKIESYALDHTEKESPLLFNLNRQTNLKVLQPRMLSGHLQGRILSFFLSTAVKPKYVLEIGTYTGYSALCLAEGLDDNGKLITIDKNPELESFATGYFEESSFKNQIEFINGDALEVIPALKYKWDLVFIDADKENYINYFDLVVDNVNSGGWIIADNVLWSGKVLQEAASNDMETSIIQQFNEKVHLDDRVRNVLFPVRDGMMVMIKKLRAVFNLFSTFGSHFDKSKPKHQSMKTFNKIVLSVVLTFQLVAGKADEGMWLPMLLGEETYKNMVECGIRLSAKDIYDANNSSLKDAIVALGGGFCTGEIISEQGLMLTNHHCGYGTIQANSTTEHDYLTDGFWAMKNPKKFLLILEYGF